jgi:hypothetical protein
MQARGTGLGRGEFFSGCEVHCTGAFGVLHGVIRHVGCVVESLFLESICLLG